MVQLGANSHYLTRNLVQYLCFYTVLIQSSYKETHKTFPLPNDHLSQRDGSELGQAGLFDTFAFTASTDESKLKLALLVDDKIDRNKDGLVQLDELVNWIRECQNKYEQEDIDRHWRSFGKKVEEDETSVLNWDEYTKKEYEHMQSLTKHSSDPDKISQLKKSQDKLIQKDLRKWESADVNSDGKLSKKEFKSFVYPEHFPHMHKLVVEEKFEHIDRNRDELVSMDEFLANLSPGAAHYDPRKREEWLQDERFKFRNHLDINHDNFLDRSELSTWISQTELIDHSVAEAKHLMQNSDSNRDHRLTKEEILAAYDEFVNSHATDFGEALRSHEEAKHDEL